MKHHIAVTATNRNFASLLLSSRLKKDIAFALQEQGIDFPCEINVMVTDDETIRAINLANRGIDRATDVLSFPMFNLCAGEIPADHSQMVDPATGLVPLGDMAISLERAKAQAKEYGHSVRREISYLTVHSVLHLLGYDHERGEDDTARMRRREKEYLEAIGLTRDDG